jgi:hypothetical protein
VPAPYKKSLGNDVSVVSMVCQSQFGAEEMGLAKISAIKIKKVFFMTIFLFIFKKCNFIAIKNSIERLFKKEVGLRGYRERVLNSAAKN